MKILLASDNYYPNINGAAYFAHRHAKQLVEFGHEVLVIAPSRNWNNEIFEHEGVKIYGLKSLPVERIRQAFPFVVNKDIYKTIKDFDPDVIHIQGHFAIGRKTAKYAHKLNIPVIGTNHFMPENIVHFLPLGQRIQNIAKIIAWKHFAFVFNGLDHVTSPTYTAARLINNAGINFPVTVVSNGIDLNRFSPEAKNDSVPSKYNLPLDLPKFLFVGRIDKEKNLDLVIKGFAQALQKTNAQLILAGSGAEMNNLKKLANELGVTNNVTFTGFVPDEDMAGLYAAADCFIMAGTAELQSIATMEAMASGLPVIAVNAMALPELAKHKQNGFLFEPDNIDQLSEAIVELAENPELRQSFGQESLKIISAHETQAVTKQFINLYKQLRDQS